MGVKINTAGELELNDSCDQINMLQYDLEEFCMNLIGFEENHGF